MNRWTQLSGYLSTFRNERILYKPNPGNGGDGIIAEATFQLFESSNIRYKIWNPSDKIEGAVVIHGGGGNLVPGYSAAADFLRSVQDRAKKVILLPHTVDGHAELLSSFGDNVTIFCREIRSYEYAKANAPKAEVLLGEDLALSLNLPLLFSKTQSLRLVLRRPYRFLKSYVECSNHLKRIHNKRRQSPEITSTGFFFREDIEKTSIQLPPDNFDISQDLSHEWTMSDRARISIGCQNFFRYLDAYERVETNRLHVAIGSLLLGKSVHLYPNSYWKNAEVFKASLRDRFANIEWHQSR